MVDAFLDRGFSYFDTAYAYPGSEEAFRKAVVERYPRDRFTIATKLAIWPLGDELTPEQEFQTQLQRSGAGYFDYYLLHNFQPAHYNDHRTAKSIESSIDFAAKRQVWQRMRF